MKARKEQKREREEKLFVRFGGKRKTEEEEDRLVKTKDCFLNGESFLLRERGERPRERERARERASERARESKRERRNDRKNGRKRMKWQASEREERCEGEELVRNE